MFKKGNHIQTIVNNKENEYILKHQYCTNLYYLLEKDRPDLPQSIIRKIIGMIYENNFTFIEHCYIDKEYFLSIVNEGLTLLSDTSDNTITTKVEEGKNPLIILKEEKFKYSLQLYNKLQQMHPSMPNLIVGKIIGMIYENSLEFICLLVQNEFDFLIIIKEALDVLMSATDK